MKQKPISDVSQASQTARTERRLLWRPSTDSMQQSNMMRFLQAANTEYELQLESFTDLYRWSVDKLEDFWSLFWDWAPIRCERRFDEVVDDQYKMPGARWFRGAVLNYAENILGSDRNERPAIIFRGENRYHSEISRKELWSLVTRFAEALRDNGIVPGDVVAAYMPNIPETVIGMLAAAAVGAVWCSCATDIGPQAASERLGQVNPKILLTTDGYCYKGKIYDVIENATALAASLKTVEKVVVCHYAGEYSKVVQIGNSVLWEGFIGEQDPKDFVFEQLPAEHPLVVMFSSGTTGKPKCMVQSAGGLLVNQLKELLLHNDLKTSDRMLYITTCSWMMWNWQLAALGTGSSIVLFDGNPSYPDTGAIWRVLEEEKVTVFGLSASYIHALLADGFSPKDAADLSALRSISQTGSALSEDGFEFVYKQIKQDLHFNSIAGGTDINGCFCTGNPLSPVYSGELQGPGLGMAIRCLGPDGEHVWDEQGELVCVKAVPSMPLHFWDDPDGEKYMSAYFLDFPGVWRHGDYVVFHSETGGVTYYGRSDSVLKPSGVRIGTAEIYNQVEKLPQIVDSLAIGQDYHGDQRILLFVQTREGVLLDDALKKDIRSILRTNASPRHVPAVIIQVPDIPKTLNGKKVESAVTSIINGRAVTNRDALQNPESLHFFESILPLLND